MSSPSSQSPQPLTDERMESLLEYASSLASGWSGPDFKLAGEAMLDLWNEVDRLRSELAEMETDRDKYQNWYDAACDEVAEAYRSRNEED